MIWPTEIAPYQYYLVGIGEAAERHCAKLAEQAPEIVLWDDRPTARNGEKFADAELLGIPCRVVISDKTLADSKVEIKHRVNGQIELLTLDEFNNKLV